MTWILRPLRGRLLACCTAAVALLAATPAAAQNTGTISGSIIDHTSQVATRIDGC
jgi:hypothetical protein